MKLSRYVVWAKESSGDYLAACTLTKAIIRLNNQAKKDLEGGNINECLELTKEQFQECAEMGFLVPVELDEKNYLRYILDKDRLSPLALTTYVAFSMVCNFRCSYCYEVGQVKGQTMNENIIESLVKWYKYKLENGHFEICSVHLYGGEPLLFTPLIISLLSKLKEITTILGVKLVVRLITNGYLLTTDTVGKLFDFGLDEIHVTLDGTEEAHNKRRPLKKGGKTFNVVFRNLLNVALLDLPLDIVCRISFDRSNVNNIPKLLEQIRQKDKTGKIDPYFGSITQTISQITIPESFCSQYVLEDEEVAENVLFLYKKAKEKGFSIPDFFTLGPCMVVAEDARVIAPDGLVYKCLDMIGREDLAIGDIFSNKPRPINYDFMAGIQLESCLNTDCSFVPVCGGGCVMEAYLKKKSHKELICHRQMLEKIYRDFLPLQFSN